MKGAFKIKFLSKIVPQTCGMFQLHLVVSFFKGSIVDVFLTRAYPQG